MVAGLMLACFMNIQWSGLRVQQPPPREGRCSQKERGFRVLKMSLSLSSATYCSFVLFGKRTKLLWASDSSQTKDAAKCVMYSRHSVGGVITTE